VRGYARNLYVAWLSACSAISVRDVHSREDLQIPLPEFLAELKATPTYVQPGETRRLYGKDYPCPREWLDWLEQRSRIPDVLRPNGMSNALRNLPDPVSAASQRK
jgi:hypothetical protein